jgi:hypothetical protein
MTVSSEPQTVAALSGHTQADADDCGTKINDQAKKHNAAAEEKRAQKSNQN